MELPESIKTTLLGIAAIFIGVGGATLVDDPFTGSILLLIAVAIIVLRGFLKAKGIQVKDEIELVDEPTQVEDSA